MIAPGFDFVPVVRSMPSGSLSALELFERARRHGARAFLESAKGGEYSYIGWGIDRVVSSRGLVTTVSDAGGEVLSEETGNPWDILANKLERSIAPHPDLQNFTGGAIGYLGYDMVRYIESLPDQTINDCPIPDATFLFLNSFVEIDHKANAIRLVVLVENDNSQDHESNLRDAEQRLDEMEVFLAEPIAAEESAGDVHNADADSTNVHSRSHRVADAPNANVSQQEFEEMVVRTKNYITEGDIFQANLSVRLDLPFNGDPSPLYRQLRRVNPSPYMTYLELPAMVMAGASPELLLKIKGGRIETRPIAGTRPRGATPEETRENARELIEDEKERAEHLMLVDLERNDIGRVARVGSVAVPEFMAIEEYSHVIHIVSHVVGELAEGRTTFDAIKSLFPGGTITGAPKIRSMEIIEELEPTRRGIYTGSAGWIGYNGDAELNIVIRTILLHNGRAWMQAGAGIVADSVPKREYRESLRKAAAALEAVQSLQSGDEIVHADKVAP